MNERVEAILQRLEQSHPPAAQAFREGLALVKEKVEQVEVDNALLRSLLREAATKCGKCGDIATRRHRRLFRCEAHGFQAKLYDLGVRIRAALESQP
jgi:hypothetical protein